MYRATMLGKAFENACREGTIAKVHSIFDKAVNIQLLKENQLLTILCESSDIMSAGCIVDTTFFCRKDKISVGSVVLLTPDIIYVSNLPYVCSISSSLTWERISSADIFSMAKPSYCTLFQNCCDLKNFLDNSGKSEMFLRTLTADKFNPLDLIGFGNGLTPSGDDFLAGVLYAMHFIRDLCGGNYLCSPETVDVISKNLHQTGAISRHFLRYAINGDWGRATENFLLALIKEKRDELYGAVNVKMAYGATSGEDELRGCLFCFMEYIKIAGGDSFVHNS